MQLQLDGKTTIHANRAMVFKMLTDPAFLAKTIPDSEDVHVLDNSTLEAKVKVRVAVVSSTLKLKISISDKEPPAKAKLIVDGSGSGSTMKIQSTFDLSGDSPTTMNWSADAEIGGIMAGLGSALLRGFGAKKIEEIFSGITREIERHANQLAGSPQM